MAYTQLCLVANKLERWVCRHIMEQNTDFFVCCDPFLWRQIQLLLSRVRIQINGKRFSHHTIYLRLAIINWDDIRPTVTAAICTALV